MRFKRILSTRLIHSALETPTGDSMWIVKRIMPSLQRLAGYPPSAKRFVIPDAPLRVYTTPSKISHGVS